MEFFFFKKSMLRGTQRTLTGVQPLVPRYWSGYQWYHGIRTTLGQHCTAVPCRAESCQSPKAMGTFLWLLNATRVTLLSVELLSCLHSRKNSVEAWRRLQKRKDPTTGGRKRNLLCTISSLGRCSLLELQAGIERWECYVSRFEKKMKDKPDDECLTNWRNT